MNNFGRLLAAACLSLSPFMLTGCNHNDRVADHIHILNVIGFDRLGSGYAGTALYTDFTRKGEVKLLQGQGRKARLILDAMNRASSRPVNVAKLRLLLFSKSVAEDGISDFIESLCKNPVISNYLYVAIAEGSVTALTESLAGKRNDDLPYYSLEQNMLEGALPRSNLSTLLYDYYGRGRDPSVPYVRLNPKGGTEIAGLAVLKDDRLKLLLNVRETKDYNILQGTVMRGLLPFEVSDGKNRDTAILSVQYGKSSRSVLKSGSARRISYRITLNGMVIEYPHWLELGGTDQTVGIIRLFERQLERRLTDLMNEFRDQRVDPLGIGDFVRAHDRHWDEKRFYEEEYPRTEFDIRVRLQLTKSGIGE